MKNLFKFKERLAGGVRRYGRVLSLIVALTALSNVAWGTTYYLYGGTQQNASQWSTTPLATSETLSFTITNSSMLVANTDLYIGASTASNGYYNNTTSQLVYDGWSDKSGNVSSISTQSQNNGSNCQLKYLKYKLSAASGAVTVTLQKDGTYNICNATPDKCKYTLGTSSAPTPTTTVPSIRIGKKAVVDGTNVTFNGQIADWGCKNVTEIKVKYSKDGGEAQTKSIKTGISINSNTTTGDIETLDWSGGEYTYTLIAHNSVGDSQESDEGTFTVQACTNPTAEQYPMSAITLNCGVSSIEIPVSEGAGSIKKTYYKKTSEAASAYTETFPTTPGTYNVKIDVNAGTTYCAKDGIELTNTLTLNALERTISFDDTSARCGAGTYTITSTASAGDGAKTYERISGNNAEITSAGVLTLTGEGGYSLRVTIAQSGCYAQVTATAEFAAATLPTLTTGDPKSSVVITATTATVTGSVVNSSGCTPTQTGIAYKKTSDAEFSYVGYEGSTPAAMEVPLSGLEANTEYTYKVYAIVNGVRIYGEEKTFTTCTRPTPGFAFAMNLNRGQSTPWEGEVNAGSTTPAIGGYIAMNNTLATIDGNFGTNYHIEAIMFTGQTANNYRWNLCNEDGTTLIPTPTLNDNNVKFITDTWYNNAKVRFSFPGTYHFILEAGCSGEPAEMKKSEVVTIEVPAPEMGIYGNGLNNGDICYAAGDGKMSEPVKTDDGYVWTKDFRLSENSGHHTGINIIQRYKKGDDGSSICCGTAAGWCVDNIITSSYGTISSYTNCSWSEWGIVPDATKFSVGDSLRLTVTMTAYNTYKVKFERFNKVRVAVKSWGNDNNTSVLQNEWWDLLAYESPVKTVERTDNIVEDYLLPGQSFTATAIPYVTDDDVHRSIFLGWSQTPDSWDTSTSPATHRQVSMETTDEEYEVTPSGDIELYAHFAFINTYSTATVNCDNVVVTGSANSYADNINLKENYNVTSSFKYKIGDDGEVSTQAASQDAPIVTTWPAYPYSGWAPVTATLTGLASGTNYKCQHVLTTEDGTDHYAYEWTSFTTKIKPTITVTPASPKAYEVITLSTSLGTEVTWSKTDDDAYFVKDMMAVDDNTVKAESIILKAPASNNPYTITATPEEGCPDSTDITVDTDSEICN